MTPQQRQLLLTHRYLDTHNAKFLSRDPIGYGGGLNLYGYAGGNPITHIDASGSYDFTISGFEFTDSVVNDGLAVGGSATASALTWDYYDGGQYRSDPTFKTSHTLAVVGREAAVWVVGGKVAEIGSRAFVTARLARYAGVAKATVQLTARQRAVVAAGKVAFNTARGTQIHNAVRASVATDKALTFLLKAAKPGEFGPDYVDKVGSWIWGERWWDITTDASQWAAKTKKYNDLFGRGSAIYYGK